MNRFYEDLHMIYIQESHESNNSDVLYGTQEYPMYLMGQVKSFNKNVLTIIYKAEIAKNYPGITTPKFFKFKRFNIQFGEFYFRDVVLLEGESVYKENGDYEIQITILDKKS